MEGSSGYYLYKQDIKKIIYSLRNNLNEYLNNYDDNMYYIFIDDLNKFSSLLNELSISLKGQIDIDGHKMQTNILNTVWLRISPNDLSDVYKFIEKQISFNKNKDYCISNKINHICNFEGYSVNYKIKNADVWYETNKKMSLYLKNESNEILTLPEIYFDIIANNQKKKCYIYAIQTCKDIKDSKNNIEETLTDIKRKLRNKYTNYKFILSLKFL